MKACLHSLLFVALWLSMAASCHAVDLAPATTAPAHAYFHKYLSGTVGDKARVTMDLKNIDGLLTGSFYGDSSVKPLAVLADGFS